MRNYLVVFAILGLVLSAYSAPLKSGSKNKVLAQTGQVTASMKKAAANGVYHGQQLQGGVQSNGFNGQAGSYHGVNQHTVVSNTVQRQVGPRQYGPAQSYSVQSSSVVAPSSNSGYSNSQSYARSHVGQKVRYDNQHVNVQNYQEVITETNTQYETHYVNGVQVQYSNQWNIQARNEHGVGTCRNFWYQSSFTLADAAGTPGEWYLNNCEVYSYFYQQYINANDIEWSNPDAEAYYYSNWVCASDSSWRIYFPQNCTWVKGSFTANGDMELTPPNQTPIPVPQTSWVQPSTVPSTQIAVPISAVPSSIETVYFSTSSVPTTIVESLPPTLVATLASSVFSALPSSVAASVVENLPTSVIATLPGSVISALPSTVVASVVETLPTTVIATLSASVFSALPTTVAAAVISSLPESVISSLPASDFSALPSTVVSALPSSVVPESLTAEWVQPSYLPSSIIAVPTAALPSSVHTVYYSSSTIPATIVAEMPSSVVTDIPSNPYPSVIFVPNSVSVPSTWVSPVVVPSTVVQNVPSSHVVWVTGSFVAVESSWVPSTVPTGLIVSLAQPPSGCACANAATSQGYFTWVPSPIVTVTITQSVTVPASISSPVVIPATAIPSSFPQSQVYTISAQSSIVVVAWSNVPSTVPAADITSVPSSLQVTVTAAARPDTTIVVPSSWTDPVVVPASWVSSVSYDPSEGFQTPALSNSVVFSFQLLPSSVPTAVVATIPQRFLSTVAQPSTPSVSVIVPPQWSSPQVVAVSQIPSSVPQVSVPHVTSVVVVSWSQVPSSVPAAALVSLPTSLVITSRIQVSVQETVTVPSTWSSPQVVPVTALPSSFPATEAIVVSSAPSVVVVSNSAVPSSVPSSAFAPLQSTLLYTVSVPTVSTQVVVPTQWSSPVIVPASFVSSLPASVVVTVPGQPSVVVVSWSNVPSSVPTAVVASLPSSNVATPIPPECQTVVDYFQAPVAPAFLQE